jgi:hypothetical protein
MILTVKRDHAKPPAGGHRYVDGSVELKGETVVEVLRKMEDYVAENALPLGHPEQTLAKYYRKIAPYLVREVPGDVVRYRTEIVAEAIMAFWRAHPEVFSGDNPLISLRQSTCEDCPFRTEFPKGKGADRPYCQKAFKRAELLCSDRDFAKRGRCSWSELPVDLICRVKKPGELEELPPVPKTCWVNSL